MSNIMVMVLYLSLFSSIFNLSLCCLESHKQILLQFKLSLIQNSSSNDEIIFDLASWDSNSDCCQWDRIICDYSSTPHSNIVELDLSKLYIENFAILIPVFNIRSLKKLDLSKNFLQGEIPLNMVTNLSQLVYLDMSYNNFSGTIPSHLFRLKNLRHLDLSGNSFSRRLSSEVGNLGNLKFLNLDGNFLIEEMPKKILAGEEKFEFAFEQ